jgi:hypothetical protein
MFIVFIRNILVITILFWCKVYKKKTSHTLLKVIITKLPEYIVQPSKDESLGTSKSLLTIVMIDGTRFLSYIMNEWMNEILVPKNFFIIKYCNYSFKMWGKATFIKLFRQIEACYFFFLVLIYGFKIILKFNFEACITCKDTSTHSIMTFNNGWRSVIRHSLVL